MSEKYVMNEMEKKLVEALRSGKYRKTSGVLKSNEDPCAYCIMGVALDIIDHGNWEPIGVEDTEWYWGGSHVCMNQTSMEHYKWKSSDSEFPVVHIPGGTRPDEYRRSRTYVSISDLNDIYGVTFPQFADLIEQGYIIHENDEEYEQSIDDRD